MDKIIRNLNRNLNIDTYIERKSLFLLGPRQTGKTTFLEENYPEAIFYSLLKNDIYFTLQKDPSQLRRELELAKKPELIIIDEIQKIPALLDEVHYLIEKKKHHFILTGSSARKLKRSGVNLLGGRASTLTFHPLNYAEMTGHDFSLEKVLNYGSLPSIYLSDDPETDLQDYVSTYLKEEIMAEGLARKLPSFSRFLEIAALSSSQMINFASIANDAQIAPTVCYEYFQVLKDTLVASELPCWQSTKKRKAMTTSKFFFFDGGVARVAQGRKTLSKNDPALGPALETYLFHELQTLTDYKKLAPLHYWRSKSNFEVDFIFNQEIAIEIKATRNPSISDLKGLKALAEEKLLKRYILVCQVERPRKEGFVEILPVEHFLKEMWGSSFS